MSQSKRFACINPQTNISDFPALKDSLPDADYYHVCKYSESHQTPDHDHVNYKAIIRMALSTEEEIKKWLKRQLVTWRVDRTYPGKGKKVIYKVDFRCQHNTKPRKKAAGRKSKHTNCPAKMSVTLLRTQVSRGRQSLSRDPHVPTFPTIVDISSDHNHNLHVADALCHRDVGDEAREKLLKLFEAGHSPTSALDIFKFDLQVEHGEDYVFATADRALCPTLEFCYRFYHQIFSQEYGSTDGVEMAVALERQIELYNTECRDQCAKVSSSGKRLLIAICSPLMKRVHSQMRHSGEMCFMDASGNMDRHHCRVFLLLTHSCAGGLPLGIIITQSEEEQVIFEGLTLLKSLLSEEAFSGRGESGPMLFLTDDSRAERAALNRAYPKAKLLLCSFHLLQAAWRWLWCKESEIDMADRASLFSTIKDLMYAREEGVMQSKYEQAAESTLVNRYSKFKAYLQKLYSRRECWALCYRETLPVRGNNTNNFTEAAMRILKDKILHRTKAYNIPQLFDFLTTRLSAYYKARITDAAIGNFEGLQKSRFLAKTTNGPEDIHKIDPTHFEVKSSSVPSKVYVVDINMEMCSCPMGSGGGPCKHQAAVLLHHKAPSSNFLPQTAETRAKLLYIATGKENVPLQFLRALTEGAGPSTDAGAEPHTWQEETGVVMVDHELQQAASEEVSHKAVAAEFAEMVGELSAMVNSNASFTTSASAAIKAFRKIKGNPSRIQSALHMFGRYTNTSLASVRSKAIRRAARHAGPAIHAQPTAVARRRLSLGGRRRLAAGRPTKVTKGTDHVYSQPSQKVRTPAPHNLAHSVSEHKRHPK